MTKRTEAIDAAYRGEVSALNRQRAHIESRYTDLLDGLTKDELYEIATHCGEERGPDHCYRCEAWSMWVDLEG